MTVDVDPEDQPWKDSEAHVTLHSRSCTETGSSEAMRYVWRLQWRWLKALMNELSSLIGLV
jgi:hypothetical protein